MNRAQFCKIQASHGYTVSNIGLMTILHYIDKDDAIYTAIWFWNADGTLNHELEPTWSLKRP